MLGSGAGWWSVALNQDSTAVLLNIYLLFPPIAWCCRRKARGSELGGSGYLQKLTQGERKHQTELQREKSIVAESEIVAQRTLTVRSIWTLKQCPGRADIPRDTSLD